MASLYDNFNDPFDDLIVKLKNNFLLNNNCVSQNKDILVAEIILKVSGLIQIPFSIIPVLKYLLCSDLLFVIRHGLVFDQKIDKTKLFFVHDFIIKIYEILAEVRGEYADFCKTREENIYETIKFWYQDSDLFGFANIETKFLLRNLIAHCSLKMNNPHLFFEYKSLIIGVYSAIIKKYTSDELFKIKVNELSGNLDEIFLKDFYNQAVLEIVNSKVLSRKNIKEHFLIESIGLIPEIKISLNTIFESRVSFKNLIPDGSGSKILPGVSSVNFEPWKVNVPDNIILDNHEFSYVVPESRRWNKCDKCKGRQFQNCSGCNGHKKKLCVDCMQGEIHCPRCSGTGEESYTETFEKLVPGEDGLSFKSVISQRTKKKSCFSCSTKGKVKCQTCNGLTQILCKSCSGQGQTKCEICEGIGRIEYNQVLLITRKCKYIEKKFSAKEKDLGIKSKNQEFTKINTLNGVNLSERILLEKLGSNVSDGFLSVIGETINREWLQSIDSKPIYQQCEIFVSYTYKVHYNFFGYQGECYWYPSFKNKAFILNGIMDGITKAFEIDIKGKNYFEAAKKIVYMENISKKTSNCLEVFQNQYKKLSLSMKFLVYVAKHFVNPESIW